MSQQDSTTTYFGYNPVTGPEVLDLSNLNKDEKILTQFNNTENILNKTDVCNPISVKYTPTNSLVSNKILSNNELTASMQFPQQGEVSISAYIFILLEFIKMVVVDCGEETNHSNKLREIGEDVGFKLLELVKFKNTIPTSNMPISLGSAEKLVTYKHSNNSKNNSSMDISQTPKATELYKYVVCTSSTSNKNIQASSLRDLQKLNMLEFIHGPLWKYMFGKKADDIQQLKNNPLEYIIIDNEPLLSALALSSQINEFLCGIIKSCVVNSGFSCDDVSAHMMENEDPKWPNKTVYVIKFSK